MSKGQKQNTKKFEPVPEGEYQMVLTESKVAPTKSGGKMLEAKFEITKGDHKGRLVFERFNLENKNPKAVQIGQDRISKFLKAVGHEDGFESLDFDATRLSEFEMEPFIGVVTIRPEEEYTDKQTGEKKMSKASNLIKAFAKR